MLEQASEAFRETETPHIFEKFEKKCPRTPPEYRTLFGAKKLQRIAISAVF